MTRMDPVEDLAAAVDWFVEAAGSRLPVPIRPVADIAAVERVFADLERRIAPFTVPPEIRWFWTTWDPAGFDILWAPTLMAADRFLWHWNLGWDDDSPRVLLPIGYASHAELQVDLSDPDGIPASVWLSDTFDDDLRCVAPSLAALVRSCAERIEGAFVDSSPSRSGTTDWYGYYLDLFEGPELQAILDRHFATSSTQRRIYAAGSPHTWPDRWQHAQRTMTGGSDPEGRTHTVAEFIAALGTGTPRARLRGRLEHLGGLDAGAEDLMRLTDETGAIDLAVPPDRMAPGWGPDVTMEVEVVGRGPLPAHPQRWRPPPDRVAEIEARHGSWRNYELSEEGRMDPELHAHFRAFVRDVGGYKQLLPLVERTERVET